MMQKANGLCRAMLFLLLAPVAGCAAGGTAGGEPRTRHGLPASDQGLSAAQDRVIDSADNFVTAISDLYAQILRENPTKPEVRREALHSWLVAARAAFVNAADDNPIYGMVNLVILVRVERYSYEQPWFRQTFGAPAAEAARAIMAEQDQRISALAGQYLTPAQAGELREAIDAWLNNHPALRTVGLVRLQDLQLARSPEQAAHAKSGSIFNLAFVDPLASLAPAVREVQRARLAARRMFNFAQRWPSILRIETELLCLDLLAEPQVASVVENVTKLNNNAVNFIAVSRQVSDDLAKLPANLKAERENAIEQIRDTVATQRDVAIKQITEATARERDAAIHQVAEATTKERSAAIEQLASSVDRIGKDLIDRITQAVAKERAAALREAGTTVNASQSMAWADLDAVSRTFVKRLVVGQCLTAIVVAVGVALVMLGYRWIASRIFSAPGNTPRR